MACHCDAGLSHVKPYFICFQLQNEKANVSYAVSHWIKIDEKCDLSGNKQWEDRITMDLSPVVCAAYLLDPYFRGKTM